MRRDTRRAWLADQRGATAVEFALVLPMLVIFILGIWYMGWSMNLGSEVRHAVELGSRIYITNPNATDNELKAAIASHLTDVPINSITLSTSTSTIGSASSQHISWSFQTNAPIPFLSSIEISFNGSYDVPGATP
jgi:Flp pilus assembly protein TadG